MCNIIDFFFFSAKRKIIRRESGNPYTTRTTQREVYQRAHYCYDFIFWMNQNHTIAH